MCPECHTLPLRHTLKQLAKPLALTHGTLGVFGSPKDPPELASSRFLFTHASCAFISSLLYLARYAVPEDRAASSCVLPTHTAPHRTVTTSRAAERLAERLATVTGVRRVHEMKCARRLARDRDAE